MRHRDEHEPARWSRFRGPPGRRRTPGTGRTLRALARVGAAIVTGLGLSLSVLAAPAGAHVQVLGTPARAGAADAVLSFHASGESLTAGVAAITVELPAGIPAAGVSWVSGPPGWQFQRSATGYLVAGPPLGKGVPGRYAVKVARLPDAPSLVFETVVYYADGTKDAWVQPTRRGARAPSHPAPVLALTGAGARTGPGGGADGGPSGGAGDGPGGLAGGLGGLLPWALVAVAAVVALGLALRRRIRRSAPG